jgi:hypothetical protein
MSFTHVFWLDETVQFDGALFDDALGDGGCKLDALMGCLSVTEMNMAGLLISPLVLGPPGDAIAIDASPDWYGTWMPLQPSGKVISRPTDESVYFPLICCIPTCAWALVAKVEALIAYTVVVINTNVVREKYIRHRLAQNYLTVKSSVK